MAGLRVSWRRAYGLLGVFVAAVGFGVVLCGAGAARERAASRVSVLHPVFRLAGSVRNGMLSDGGWVYIAGRSATASGMLVDERTGGRRVVSRRGCGADFFGGPWLLFVCPAHPQTVDLYLVAGRRWRAVTLSAQAQPVAVGRDWIDLLEDPMCPDIGACDSLPTHVYESIATGALRRGPETIGGGTVVDLNRPSLSRPLCAPLQVGELNIGRGDIPAPLDWYGSFATTTTATTGSDDITYLERCGTRLHRPLETVRSNAAEISPQVSYAGNPDLVVWPSGAHVLSGLWLPTLVPFRISVPNRVGRVQASTGSLDELFVTLRHLYLLDGTTLWAAPVPPAPPS